MPFPLPSHNCTCLLSSPPQTLLISNKSLFLYDSYRFTVAEALSIKSRDISVQVRKGYIWNMKWRTMILIGGDGKLETGLMTQIKWFWFCSLCWTTKERLKNFNINTVIWSSKFGLVLEGNWLQIKSSCTECQWPSLNMEWKLYWPCGLSAACTLGSRPRALGLTLCDISVGCSWTRHCTRTLSLSTQKLYWAVNCLETW